MGRVRIIAGEFRGRRIDVPDGLAVRPTPDRVREALFSSLGHDLQGLKVLDAYAGSGALGLEAISRGATHATLIEDDPRALAALARNVAALAVDRRTRVVRGRVERVLPTLGADEGFDLVLADPPYDHGPAAAFLELVNSAGVLAGRARVVYQRDHRTPPVEGAVGAIRWVRTTRYGRTSLDYYVV